MVHDGQQRRFRRRDDAQRPSQNRGRDVECHRVSAPVLPVDLHVVLPVRVANDRDARRVPQVRRHTRARRVKFALSRSVRRSTLLFLFLFIFSLRDGPGRPVRRLACLVDFAARDREQNVASRRAKARVRSIRLIRVGCVRRFRLKKRRRLELDRRSVPQPHRERAAARGRDHGQTFRVQTDVVHEIVRALQTETLALRFRAAPLEFDLAPRERTRTRFGIFRPTLRGAVGDVELGSEFGREQTPAARVHRGDRRVAARYRGGV